MKEIIRLNSEANIVRRLEQAVREGSAIQVKRILSALSDVKQQANVLRKFSSDVLMAAVRYDKMVILMLLRLASPQKKQELISNALDAIMEIGGHTSMFELLLQQADSGLRQASHERYFNFALNNRLVSTARLLLQDAAPERKQELIKAAFAKIMGAGSYIPMVEMLLQEAGPKGRGLAFPYLDCSIKKMYPVSLVRVLLAAAAPQYREDFIWFNLSQAIKSCQVPLAEFFFREVTADFWGCHPFSIEYIKAGLRIFNTTYNQAATVRKYTATELHLFSLFLAYNPEDPTYVKKGLSTMPGICCSRCSEWFQNASHCAQYLPYFKKAISEIRCPEPMNKRADAYKKLIASGIDSGFAEAVATNAKLQLVCHNISGIFPTIKAGSIFPLVCTFLGIPQFQQPVVVIPALPSLKHVERSANEENKHAGHSL